MATLKDLFEGLRSVMGNVRPNLELLIPNLMSGNNTLDVQVLLVFFSLQPF